MTSPDRFDDERWRSLGALFDEVADEPEPVRASRIAQIAESDAELAEALAGLLAADRAPAAVLDAPPAWRPALGSEAPVEPPPERAGVYRIVGRLGRGGQADVYEGVRDDGTFEQRVAVKVLRRGLDTGDLLERFLAERRILARLEHPAIARLLDGGALPDGRPYFVLERVEGVPIERYAAEQRLDVAGRLRLLLAACDAVAYAHRNLVVHRDLKPSNVLVSAAGEVKLLDFGIAKLIDPEPDAVDAPTIRELRLLTPSYAAPEQLAGRPTTTATDVWGLGSLAYELLVGEAPYASRPERRSPADGPPPRPSVRVLELGDGGASARRRASELRGDLDVVLLRALDLDPRRRYPSVEAFADDLRRHLDGRPVAARLDSIGYRLGKLARRHRVAAVASALAATAVLAAAVVALRQARVAALERDRAERRFEQVRRLAESLLFDLHDRIEHLPGSLEARRALVAEAETYLDALAAEAGDDVRLERDLAAAYERLGNLTGGSRSAQLGATADALRHFERARILRERLADAPDPAPADVEALADHRLQAGALLRGSGDLAGAAAAFRDGIARLTGLERTGRSTRDPRLLLAGLHQRLSEIELRQGDAAAAERSARAAEAAASGYVADHPAAPAGRNNLAAAHSEMAQALAARGDTKAAMERLARAIDLWERLRAEDPHNTRYLRALAYSHHAQGRSHSQSGDRRRAVASHRRELEIAGAMVAADPSDRYARLAVGIAESALGGALLASEESAEGIAVLRRGRQSIEQVITEDPANGFARGALAGADLAFGRAQIDSPRSGERAEACAALARATAAGAPVPDALLSRCPAERLEPPPRSGDQPP